MKATTHSPRRHGILASLRALRHECELEGITQPGDWWQSITRGGIGLLVLGAIVTLLSVAAPF